GPVGRAAKLLADLKDKGLEPRSGAFSAPAGLETGADTPDETALSVAAEILAVRFGRKGGRPARLRPAGSSPSSRKGGSRSRVSSWPPDAA
ncbi:XdhC family protein, partial [Acinetobacter baumannii]